MNKRLLIIIIVTILGAVIVFFGTIVVWALRGQQYSQIWKDGDALSLYAFSRSRSAVQNTVVRLGIPTATTRRIGDFSKELTIVPTKDGFLVSDYASNKGDTQRYDANGKLVQTFAGVRMQSFNQHGSIIAAIVRNAKYKDRPTLLTEGNGVPSVWSFKTLNVPENTLFAFASVVDDDHVVFSYHEDGKNTALTLHVRELTLSTKSIRALADFTVEQKASFVAYNNEQHALYATRTIDAGKNTEQQIVRIDTVTRKQTVLYHTADTLRPLGTNGIDEPALALALIAETSRAGNGAKAIFLSLADGTVQEDYNIRPIGWFDYRSIVASDMVTKKFTVYDSVTHNLFPFPKQFITKYPNASFLAPVENTGHNNN